MKIPYLYLRMVMQICIAILTGCVFCTEPELKELHMVEQLHILVAQRNKTGALIKFSVSVVP